VGITLVVTLWSVDRTLPAHTYCCSGQHWARMQLTQSTPRVNGNPSREGACRTGGCFSPACLAARASIPL